MSEVNFFDQLLIQLQNDESPANQGEKNPPEVEDPNMAKCFKTFDKDKDSALNIEEFSTLLKALFKNDKGESHHLDSTIAKEIFDIFNKSENGSISKDEFSFCWSNWIQTILHPVSCFIVVDVQNDFIGGNLAISNCPAGHDGYEVVAPINNLLDTVPFDAVCYSLDWHPADHSSFVENVHIRKLDATSLVQDPKEAKIYDTVVFEGPPSFEMKLWPTHCIQGSWGSELHKDLKVHPGSSQVYKGTQPNVDSYSAFFDNNKLGHTELESIVRKQNITDVYICGIALDVCVGSTAIDALDLGFRTIFIEDCCRGIDPNDIKDMLQKIKSNHGVIVSASEVLDLVKGRDRRVELGYKLALECRKQGCRN